MRSEGGGTGHSELTLVGILEPLSALPISLFLDNDEKSLRLEGKIDDRNGTEHDAGRSVPMQGDFRLRGLVRGLRDLPAIFFFCESRH